MSIKNKNVLVPLILGLVILVLGLVGWLVMKNRSDTDKKTTSSSVSVPESSPTTDTSSKSTTKALADGWTAFTIDETRIEIGYPTEWGDPSVQKEAGYSNYNYDTPVSDGTSTYTVSFSAAADVSVSLYSNNYLNAPHGGSTGYGTVGFCKEASGYKLKQRMSTESGGVGIPACAAEVLTGTVSELAGGEAILDLDEPFCSEGGCSDTTDMLVKKLSTTEFTAVLLKGDTLTLDQASKFADYAHSL